MATSSQRTLKADFIEGILSQKNYIRNPGAKDNTLGWVTYKNTSPSSKPETGTGGSPSVTLTRSTSSPLSGDACFLFTKTGSDFQGEGFSYDFEIDRADEGKVFTISLDYAVASGTYSGGTSSTNSDLTVYIISKEFGTVIQPSGFKLDGAVVGVTNNASCSFQPPVSAGGGSARQFRLAFHVATTSTSAYTIKLDNISVSPIVSSVSSSPIVAKYYHTLGTSLSAGTIINFDTKVTDTSASVTTGGSWKFTAPEPGTYEIVVYIESSSFAATAGDRWTLDLHKNGTFHEQQGRRDVEVTGSQYRASTASYTIDLLAGEYIDVRYGGTMSFPLLALAGYSNIAIKKISSQSLSGSGRLVDIQYTRTTDQSIPYNTFTIVTYPTKQTDSSALYDTTTGEILIKEPGDYFISGLVYFLGLATGSGQVALHVFKNGSSINIYDARSIGFSTEECANAVGIIPGLVSGDIITLRAFQNNTASVARNARGHLSFYKLSNQAQIGPGEEISARAYTATAGSYSTGDNIVWDGKSYDTHNALDIATGKFTAPAPGRYRLKAQIRFQSSSNTQGDLITLLAEKNDADYAIIDNLMWPFTGSGVIFLQGDTTIQMNAGDTCNIYAAGFSGTRTLSTNFGLNYIEIERIG